jgi:hypothetical protein
MHRLLPLLLLVGCFEDEEEPGAFSLTWSIVVNGEPAGCDVAGVAEIEVLTTNVIGANVSDQFACATLEGTTPELVADTYVVAVSALDAGGRVVRAGTAFESEVFEGDTTALGNFEFVFSTQSASLDVAWTIGGAPPEELCPVGATIDIEIDGVVVVDDAGCVLSPQTVSTTRGAHTVVVRVFENGSELGNGQSDVVIDGGFATVSVDVAG